MKKSIRAIALAASVIVAASSLVGCSAYNSPEKYITVPGKGTVTIKSSDIDKDYDDQVKEILEKYRKTEYTKLTDKDELVKKGDQVNIYYEGKPLDSSVKLSDDVLNGMKYTVETEKEANDKLKESDPDAELASGYDLVIGSKTFIAAYEHKDDPSKNTDGFEDQLIGKKAGDKVSVKVTFPSDYQTESLRDVVAVFEVTINSISRAYVNDDTTIKIVYDFIDPDKKDEEKTDGNGDTKDEGDTKASASSESGDSQDKGSDKPSLDDDKTAFADLFKTGSFTYDFTDPDKDAKFFDFLKTADYVEQFKGKELNTEITVKITVPKDADEKYKDYYEREIEVKFTVSEITHLPEWNDKLVSEYTKKQYKTIDEFKEYSWNIIAQNKAFDAISDATVVNKYPSAERKKAYKSYVDQLVYAALGNKNPSDFSQKELNEKISKEKYQEIHNSAANSANESVKQRMVIEYLCKIYDIKITNKEYKEKLQQTFNQNIYTYIYSYKIYSADQLERQFGKDYFKLQFRAEKLMEKLTDYVVIE